MGYNSNCIDQTCSDNCCDSNGYCTITGSTYCTYYYDSVSSSTSTYNYSIVSSEGL